ncbi:MAG: hypothetical protein CMK64_05045 [Pseudoalteromonas sp.]|nr:hypothetical protein [Pseudoalteromonas sp.]|tara:strand:- start:17669 stop:20338 length:2670 start_codon:yes stop_codon:yes gene_type:complete
MKEIKLNEFMSQFGSSIKKSVINQLSPIYLGKTSDCSIRDRNLNALPRPPFAAQKERIQAVVKLLVDENSPAAILNADMGTGKTQMATCIAALLANESLAKRFLILSPPHLVYKWRREIKEIIGKDTKVTVLNGADSLAKLLALRDLIGKKEDTDVMEFFVLGRVRMRMGFHWKPAYTKKLIKAKALDDGLVEKDYICTCPNCGKEVITLVKDEKIVLTPDSFPTDRRIACFECEQPLWSLEHPNKPLNNRERVIKELRKIPLIGNVTATKLVDLFGEEFIQQTLSDNHMELVNLMTPEGDFFFSEKKASRMEKAFSSLEFALGSGGYQPTEFIKRYLPNNFFDLLIVDEGHEYKNYGTAQGAAMGVLCNKVRKALCLTGTLMGGYADDVFYLLWRLMPKLLIDEKFAYKHGSLQGAAMDWLKMYGSLETVYKSRESSLKTSNANNVSVSTRRRPGFAPLAIVKHILPYTVFMRLSDIEEAVLPEFTEHTHWIDMDGDVKEIYDSFSDSLITEMRKALAKGDTSLLGATFAALMAYPDTAYQSYTVTHPRDRSYVIAHAQQSISNDDLDPKTRALLDLCLENKSKGRRTLVYTTFTGKRDTTSYLKMHLENQGLTTYVLKSTVQTQQREDWIFDKVEKGCEVLICNPELVKTGLDLLDFPSIAFLQTGYNVYTLMQARMRSFRIGQQQDVDVHYFGYAECAQQQCLELMVKKIAVSQSTSGEIPDCGLDALNVDDSESLESAIAKDLVKVFDENAKDEKVDVLQDDLFGNVVSVYTRSQAIEDGFLVDVTDWPERKEAGISYPVAFTSEAFNDVIAWNNKTERTYQDESGRLWDVFTMLKLAIKNSTGNDDVTFEVLRVPSGGIKPVLKTLIAKCHAGDELEPVITISS